MVTLAKPDIERFHDQGYLLIKDALDIPTVLDPIRQDYSKQLDTLAASMQRDGRLTEYAPDAPFLDRVLSVYREGRDLLVQDFDITLPVRKDLPADTPICLAPSIFAITMNEHLLDIIETILGPEIAANPIQHVRIKPPERDIPGPEAVNPLHRELGINRVNGLLNQTPWHQDKAVITPDADATDMLTVWVPLTDCTEENGCLVVHPGSHAAGLRPHVTGTTSDLTIAEGHVADGPARSLPARPGDVILIHPHLHHASLANRSRAVRWSLDLRYHRAGQPSGRALLPSFIARSRSDPRRECRAVSDWVREWHEARDRIARMDTVPPSNRWGPTIADSPID